MQYFDGRAITVATDGKLIGRVERYPRIKDVRGIKISESELLSLNLMLRRNFSNHGKSRTTLMANVFVVFFEFAKDEHEPN